MGIVALVLLLLTVIFLKVLVILGLGWGIPILLLLLLGCVLLGALYLWKSRRQAAGHRKKQVAIVSLLLVICITSAAPTPDTLRFTLLGNVYEKAAQELAEDLVNYPDDYFVELPLPNTYFPLSIGHTSVTYCKFNHNLILAFTKRQSFFSRYDYVWVSSPGGEELLESPASFFPTLSDGPGYDWKRPLGMEDWWYIKWY